jgi:hypothetical protein
MAGPVKRLLGSFVWLRWRLLLNSLRGGRRQDRLENLSRVLSLLAPVAVVAIFCVAAVALAVLGFVAGSLIVGPNPDMTRAILSTVRLLLLVVVAVIVLVPLGRSMQGGFPGTQRLLLLPIPRSTLHLVDVAAGLLDPWLVFLVPGLVMLCLGAALAGHALAGALAFGASIALMVALACLSALLTFLLQWILRDRRRAEAAAIIFTLALAGSGLIPTFLVSDLEEKREVRVALPSAPWTLALPTELFAWSLRAAVQGRTAAAAAGIGGLLASAAILFFFSARVHAHLLTTTANSGRRGRGVAGLRETGSIPGLGPAAAGIARVQVSTALRALRGRMGVFLNAPALLVIGLLTHRLAGMTTRDGNPLGFTADGPTLFGMGVLLSLLSLQPILMNQFASDRAGLTLQFLSPVSERDLLLGKACGGAWLAALSGGLCLLAAWAISPRAPLWAWAGAVGASAATVLLGAPVAALLSLLFPRRADLSRMGNAGNAHAAATFLGWLLVMVAAVPGSLLLLAASWLEMPVLAVGGSALLLALSAGAAWALLCLLAPVLRERRENILLVAAGG